MKAINVEVKYGLAYIDDKCCSFETVEIREDIEKIVEKGKDFILPNKYSYVVTKSKSFAKIINNPSRYHEAKTDKTMKEEMSKKELEEFMKWVREVKGITTIDLLELIELVPEWEKYQESNH